MSMNKQYLSKRLEWLQPSSWKLSHYLSNMRPNHINGLENQVTNNRLCTARMQRNTVHDPISFKNNIWIHTYLTKLLRFEIRICPWCVNERDDGKPMTICIFHHPQSLPITNMSNTFQWDLYSSIQYNQIGHNRKLSFWTLAAQGGRGARADLNIGNSTKK